ncbi:TPA: BRO family protein [Citrobacter koseri]|uniref:BRO family protein n=1 Tax=Citrobacter koseri TaxID=545 RepID=UPI000D9E8FFC|nr:BRO family protein [Citrobacter koseri]SQB62385.1 P22AR C-terminal domain [Citrobacter koseri]
MSSLAISNFNFQGVTLKPVERAGDLWFSSADLAKALGYKKTDAVTQIYSRYSDEFGANMSTTLRERVVRKTGSVEMLVRFFSLRGAHLVAMFASTPKAKEFRRWVLDILDREVQHSPIAKQFSDDELISLCYMQLWMEKSKQVSKALYPALKQVGSQMSGVIYDIANETRFTAKCKEALLRETEKLDGETYAMKRAQPMLARLRGEEWIH